MADMMAKLAAAEAEAEKLRSELKETAAAPAEDLSRQTPAKGKSRIDGVGGREPLFGTSTKPGDAWLNDGMEFLVREQPSESGELQGMTEEEQNTVNRRLAIGLFGTAVFAGLSQISDESSAPSKPLFFYLVPLVKIRELLRQATDLAENGYWDDLTVVVNQITRQNDARGNLFAAAAYLSGKDEERAKQMAFDFLELLEKVDYNKYFESMKGVPVSGAKAAEDVSLGLALARIRYGLHRKHNGSAVGWVPLWHEPMLCTCVHMCVCIYVYIYIYVCIFCLLYTSPSPRDATLSRMPSSA